MAATFSAKMKRAGSEKLNIGDGHCVSKKEASPTYIAKKSYRANRTADIFGDFFGFGENPNGCMAKDGPAIDVKKEKDKYMSLLELEAKRYNIQNMYTDINAKTD